MDKEQELKELLEEIAELWEDEDWYYFYECRMDELSKLLCSDEALARKFFTECTDKEFDMAYQSYDDLAMTYDQEFIRWLAINASHRDLDIDDWYDMHVAMVIAGLMPKVQGWEHKTPEERRRIVLDAIHKLEAEREE